MQVFRVRGLEINRSYHLGKDFMARRIAVVDYDSKTRILCQESLQKRGYEVRSFGSGSAAVQGLATWAPDVMVIDGYQPGMNGFECVGILRKSYPDLRFVFITGFSYWDAAENVSIQGIGDTLTKPFSGTELTEKVQSVLDSPKNVQLTVRGDAGF
jgi:DNA-binding NtrC family response regulator